MGRQLAPRDVYGAESQSISLAFAPLFAVYRSDFTSILSADISAVT